MRQGKRDGVIKNCILSVGLVVFIFFIIKWSKIMMVSGDSMAPTIRNGTIVRYKPYNNKEQIRAGDIIVFKENNHFLARNLVKRVIALPGDTVSMQDSMIYVNGMAFYKVTGLDEKEHFKYIKNLGILSKGPLYLKENEYFVLGDNTEFSMDSREFGPITYELILGTIKE